jgi:hypothetical protein
MKGRENYHQKYFAKMKPDRTAGSDVSLEKGRDLRIAKGSQ